MTKWREFRLWHDIAPNQEDLFTFKKTHVIPILERCNIEDFLMLDEPEFILLRVEAGNESTELIRSYLEEVIKPLFLRLTIENWSPITDARNRILTARERAQVPREIPEGGWRVMGKTSDGGWAMAPEDLDKQVMAFSTFISRVLGKFTKAYIKEMPYRVQDRWLMSVFVHLILDSISTWQKEENEIREFPYI